MDGGDLCEADVGDLREGDDGELAIARSHTTQLPPNVTVVYRCAADVGDRHDVRLASLARVIPSRGGCR